MNIQANINKLLIAIRQKGKDMKLDSKMFYSDKLSKWVTKFTLWEKVIVEEDKTKWVSIWNGFSKSTLLRVLADYYNKIGSDADE